ncbi:MAG: hypothetical protein HY006_04170 [Candidatus Sungbacteria bacterium]|nr:hypothetical protein [Candidatus Sungbacteria bacterium]
MPRPLVVLEALVNILTIETYTMMRAWQTADREDVYVTQCGDRKLLFGREAAGIYIIGFEQDVGTGLDITGAGGALYEKMRELHRLVRTRVQHPEQSFTPSDPALDVIGAFMRRMSAQQDLS